MHTLIEMRCTKAIFAICVLLLLPGNKTWAQLGHLPPAPVLTKLVEDVEVEISIRFWVDPNLISDRIPPEANLLRVKDYGIPDSVIAPEFQDWIDASLIFLSANVIDVGGISQGTSDNTSEGFWWLQINEGEPAHDPRTRGNHQAIELSYWIADSVVVDHINHKGGRAEFGEITTASLDNGWAFSFSTIDTEVKGNCRLYREVSVEDYSLPAYSTVWLADPEASAFIVFTYQGHRTQRCTIEEISVSGESMLARSLRSSIQIQNPFGVVMDGWEAKSGLYVRDP